MKLFTWLLPLLCITACAPKSIESYNTAGNEEEITRLLNERDYQKAIFLVESKHGKMPADKNIAFLLGQAYLGKMDFEPLLVASRVSEAQNFSSAEARLLFPDCQSGRVKEIAGPDLLCLLKRIYLHVPSADREEFTRARDLFRLAYPSPAESPEWVNVLIGMVETASVVKRVGSVYVFALGLERGGSRPRDPTETELAWLARQMKRAHAESAQALIRAEHGGEKISKFLTGTQGAPLFQKAKSAVSWATLIGLGNFFDSYRETLINPEQDTRYSQWLNGVRAQLDEQAATLKKP